MTTSIYLRNKDGSVIEMKETAYDSEDLFQRLLAESQELLPGAQIDPEAPRRWLLVAREVGVPDQEEAGGRWSLDHLFLDQDGVPTFVEVKRSSDTRLRREVVGQMLDYAANATVYWPANFIYERFAEQCDAAGFEADAVLTEFLGHDASLNRFWENVHTNLLAGKIRLLFVADSIPTELRRIIEFLNERMDPTEVLGVEVKQYIGGDLQSFIPAVIGRTAEAQAAKSDRSPGRKWDEESFFSALAAEHSEDAVWVARELLNWARVRGLPLKRTRWRHPFPP